MVTAVFSLSPLVIPGDSKISAAAALRTPFAYDAVAPLSNTLDALTLLTPSQYAATAGLCALIFLAGSWNADPRTRLRDKLQNLARSAVLFTAASVAVVGLMLIAPRPMASIELSDHDLVVVDFHSHTSASHDGRAGFDSERNREWHRRAGFDVAYLTDHRTFAGALDGGERNPATAELGVVLLPGVELHDRGEHPILLGVDPLRTKITSPDWPGTTVVRAAGSVPPVLLLSMPGSIGHLPRSESAGSVRLAGIEVSDGSPRGMAQSARDGAQIEKLSRTLGIPLVSGSDNHGWGQTAPAWTVVRIPGWRQMRPPSLDAAIRLALLENTPGSLGVIIRRTAIGGSGHIESALAGVAVVVTLLRSLNVRERFSWIAWSWLGQMLALVRVKRNRRRLRLLVRGRIRQRVRPLIEVAALEAAS
jgi:hypothetical protein